MLTLYASYLACAICSASCLQLEQMSSPALTQCVRKELAMAIRDLMQHGLMEVRSAWRQGRDHNNVTCSAACCFSILEHSAL